MKVQRFSLTCFVALALACLVPLLSAVETTPKKDAAKPSGAFFLAPKTELKFKDIVKAWNAAHKDKAISDDVKVTDKSMVFEGYYAPKGTQLDAAKFVKCYNDAEAVELGKKLFETNFIKDEDMKYDDIPTISLYLGYKDSVAIGFPKDDKDVEPVLKEHLVRKIYGLEEVKADEAGFTDAIKAVYGDNEIVFDKIPVDSKKSNLDNLKAYLTGIKTDKIKDDEADAKLKAIRDAVKVHNEKKTKETLEEVKKAWLHKLKGDASASGNGSGLPGWAWGVIIAGAVVALAGAGYGVYRFMQKGGSN